MEALDALPKLLAVLTRVDASRCPVSERPVDAPHRSDDLLDLR